MVDIQLELSTSAPCSSADIFKINGKDAAIHDFGFAETRPLSEEELMGACYGCELEGFSGWDKSDEEYSKTLKNYGLTPEEFDEVVRYLDNEMISVGSCCMCD